MPRRTLGTVLESRITEGLDVGSFLTSLNCPPLHLVAKRLHLGSPLKFTYWRSHKYLPWAVYIALRDIYGTPKFHEVPRIGRAKRAVRIPEQLQKYLEVIDLAPKAPEPCPHDFKPTSLGYLMCAHCGERGEDIPEPTPVVSAPLPAPTPTGFSIPIVWQGPNTLTLRIEVVSVASHAATPNRERELLTRIAELEDMITDLKVAPHVQNQPSFSKTDRHLLRTVAKQNPDQARTLARTLNR